jgi:hypothetical protein
MHRFTTRTLAGASAVAVLAAAWIAAGMQGADPDGLDPVARVDRAGPSW